MSEKMSPADRELLIAATLAAGCCDVDTDGEQAVRNLRDVLTRIAQAGGVTRMRREAYETARKRHQTSPAR